MMHLSTIPTPTVAMEDSKDRFAIRRIYCVGQNYRDHAREMGADPDRPAPFFFSKPSDAVVENGAVLPFPLQTQDLHHEAELVVALGAAGSMVSVEDAPSLIFGYAVGIDLTRRDLQAEAKRLGRPWDLAKGFDQSAPIGPIRRGVPPSDGLIQLWVDDALRQRGDVGEMIWRVPEIIATLSTFVALQPGDLLFTGTPAGVGRIAPGQTVRAQFADLDALEIRFRS